ncbi:MAG TPA: OmpA family protein [Chitinophagaceae bacterium]|nr:OmpA family protein [Chitinophagaceae bacterium]
MKKIFLLISICILTNSINGQVLKKVTDRAKNRAENNANNKVNNTIDKTVDDAMDPNLKKNKTAADTTKKREETQGVAKNENTPANFKAYSKYDFVPGEKVIGFEDFSTGSIGDFPAGWNTTGAGETVTVDGKPGRWLWITKPGVYIPEFTQQYPEDFTFEFDLLHGTPFGGATFHFVMAELSNTDNLGAWNTSPHTFKTGFYITSSGQKEGSVTTEIRKSSTTQPANQISTELMSDKFNPVHVSIWRQKERVRVYVNQEKVWDIPKAIAADAKLNTIFFPVVAADPTIQFYIGNLRLAVGAPDTRKRMLEQNKWVTHGILFDVNSATIKPESYGTLKEMANVLKEYSDLKVKIVGHTDADGSDAANLDLSKRRAASVRSALAKEFGIDETRMETDGKGESEPIDKNDTPAGKANNRRVEFIRI